MKVLFEGSMRTGAVDEPWYHVERQSEAPQGYRVTRLDLRSPCTIGTVRTRGEAVRIARMLAGWRGLVTAGKRQKDTRLPQDALR